MSNPTGVNGKNIEKTKKTTTGKRGVSRRSIGKKANRVKIMGMAVTKRRGGMVETDR
jgi:hypothetical protein